MSINYDFHREINDTLNNSIILSKAKNTLIIIGFYFFYISIWRFYNNKKEDLKLKYLNFSWNSMMLLLNFYNFFYLIIHCSSDSLVESLTNINYFNNDNRQLIYLSHTLKVIQLFNLCFKIYDNERNNRTDFTFDFCSIIYSICCNLINFPLLYWYNILSSLNNGLNYIYKNLQLIQVEKRVLIYFDISQIIIFFWGALLNLIYIYNINSFGIFNLILIIYGLMINIYYLKYLVFLFDHKYQFKNDINWPMSFYLLTTHILAIIGLFKINNLYLFIEMILWYQICGWGVTAGMHRLWSHRSFKAKLPTRIFLMILASMSNQGSIYHWCRDHRTHHKFSDTDSDPHNIKRGFFYSHMGWLLLKKDNLVISAGKTLSSQDLLDDWVVWINYKLNPICNHFWCYIIPGLYGLWRLKSFWDGLLIFGSLRWIIELHSTWCVNSVSHTYGYRPYKDIEASENLFTSLVANGEGWHNWHHAFPYDYAAAEDGFLMQWNHTKILIDFLWLFGQTYNLKRKRLKDIEKH